MLKLRLVVDSNILFAALIKEGITAKLLLSERLELFAPERLIEEFRKYEEYILSKTHRSKVDFERFLSTLEGRIEIIPKSEFEEWVEEAKKVCKLDDFPFVALAKALLLQIAFQRFVEEKLEEFKELERIVEKSELTEEEALELGSSLINLWQKGMKCCLGRSELRCY